MPAQYVAIRDKLASRGVDYDRAQAIAAATFKRLTGRSVQEAMARAHEGMHARKKGAR